MTEANPTQAEPTGTETKEPERTFTQAELDKAIADRLKGANRKHADELAKFADYDDLKAKADKLDELEAANKSELEKLTDSLNEAARRADEAEAKAARLEAKAAHDALVTKVAAEEEVPAALINGADEDELRASAQALKDYIKAKGPKVPEPSGGATPKPDDEDKLSEREERAFRL